MPKKSEPLSLRLRARLHVGGLRRIAVPRAIAYEYGRKARIPIWQRGGGPSTSSVAEKLAKIYAPSNIVVDRVVKRRTVGDTVYITVTSHTRKRLMK
jgi:hypothetical protein